ncbi:zinc finger CCCH domain-containing protein 43-like isoform X2 [Lycium ferocissimum]|uniref:zinc finger CCCH domain-containing protein 43-like isoform X2 n=1 Tax=Lycium ferocissimum TaxID=112874 RepID=UPI0028149C5C|nr:zinc finger CCCH domain-containing protein 43-like isoform X2 [Lycium ferocissimum]
MEAIQSHYIHNLNHSTLDKQHLGFDPQPQKTSSFSPHSILQNPTQNPPNTEENDVDDEIALKISVEELQNLVLNQAFSEERLKGDIHEENEPIKKKTENEYVDNDYEDEIAVKSIIEELQNLVLNQAFEEQRAKRDIYEENGRDDITIKVKTENEYGSNRWGDDDCGWSENGNGNVIDVENEKGGSKEWGFNANGRSLNYPLRPDAEDCAYYMRTGTCKYGLSCKFNHPSRMRDQHWAMEKGKQKEESEERAGQIECKYFLTEGGCKYGNACKYNHSRRKGVISPVQDFNFLGLPLRPGGRDCPYYMRTGSCKYGSNCRFHHPDPTTIYGSNPSSGYNNGGSAPIQSASYPTGSSWSSPPLLNKTSPLVPGIYPASQGIPPLSPQWNRFQAPVYPTSDKILPTPPALAMKDLATKTNFYPRPQPPWLVEEYPERPGQPDCSYFIKTGDCKYKFNCKFHHPKTQMSKTNPSVLSVKGLPLRPGQDVCSFYSRYGICKFGPACKFDHPEHYDNSASSLGFAFYQPPLGNSASTDGLRMGRKGNGSGSILQQSV